MGKRFQYLFGVSLCLVGMVLLAPALGVAGELSAKPAFRDFNGVVYLPGSDVTKQLGIGWAREGFYWNQIEPAKGKWIWGPFDRKLLAAKAEGVQILPLLAYNTPWDTRSGSSGFSPPESVADWEDFIEHVVARYSAPPYNLRYFQIWNEPTLQAGFWSGTDEEFVDEVYLPAAEIIRRHGCFVVFGGWPDSNSVQEFDSVLEYHDAWKWTDILDVHYEGLPYFEYLYDRWVKTGKCKGIWETELGFTDDPDFIPSVYLPILHWALEDGWNDPNQYKLFWYAAWGAGPDGPHCLSQTNSSGQLILSDQGQRLAVLSRVLGGNPLQAFSGYQTAQHLPSGTVMGFRSGKDIVIALMFSDSRLGGARFVSLRVPLPQKPRSVDLMNEDGVHIKLTTRFHKGYVMVRIPLTPLAEKPGKMAIGYLDIDPASTKN